MEMSFWRGIQGRADEQEAASYARLRRDAFEVSVTTEDSSSRGSRQGEGKVSGLALPPCCEGDFTLWAMRCHSGSPRRSLGPRRELDVRLIREAPATLTRSTRPAAAAQMLTGDVADTDGAAAVGFSRGKSRREAPGISVHDPFGLNFIRASNKVSLAFNRLFAGALWLTGERCHHSVTFSLGGRA